MVQKKELHILIITGLSGAGKTQTINVLEDMGYYCVDNLPPALLFKFVEIALQAEGRISKVALVIDVRGGAFFKDLSQALSEMQQQELPLEIIFLEASDDVLVRRFKESRRRHPLFDNRSLLEAIKEERNMLEELRGQATVIIDTSPLTSRELKEKLQNLFSNEETSDFIINVMSFGYKAGIPLDADLVIDVRFLANPYYDKKMRSLTGKDREVIDFVLNAPVTKSFTRRFLNLLNFLLPHYIAEGKSTLTLAVGCTGGQHRSVALTDYIGRQLNKLGYKVIIRHRDIEKYIVQSEK